MVEAGTVIDGRYEVLSRIGTGGMADVYLARDQLLGRQVAVKLLHHRFAEDQEFVERFRREASSAAGLSHPNVVAIFDRGEWDGTYYIAMEYLPGRSLKTVVREMAPLQPVGAIDIVLQILLAARFAHRRGVIHRDLKPHNVILDEEGRAKVTDFGIARAGASDMTLTGSIMGTAQYLSPEQAQGQAVSAASDLYAIGIVLYELLTGRVPFDGETAVTIALKQVSAAPPPPSALNQEVPPELDAVVARALAKDPGERFADADEFIAALEQVRHELTGEPIHVHGGNGPVPPTTATAVLAAASPPAAGGENGAGAEESAARRRRLWWIAGAALLLAAAAAALILLLPGSRRQVTVPGVTGLAQASAEARLTRAGLTPVATSRTSATVPQGGVISESPGAGSVVDRAARVTLAVSSGPGTATVPDVKGLAAAQAVQRLRGAGFKPTRQSEASSTVASGKVVATEPAGNTDVQAGSPVTVLVSSGPAPIEVPEVTGQREAEAKASLRAAGLAPGTVERREAKGGEEVGEVLSQSPSAGESAPAGTHVNLVVAAAPKEVEVPRVVGKSEAQAAGELGQAGFKPRSKTREVTKSEEAGIVLQQSPAGGHKAKPGATVTITVGELAAQTTPNTTTTPPPSTTTTTTTAAQAPSPE
ncbi:MAG TPA: Stk1 family PASTA domain-containing Ser/Thr kinase [Solirubrobacteraceae bacterium]|nr:Stk1 family PASTA domain-containing Ser/Thr kinase [Solirubrobacteraceae bacterium]